AAATATAQAPVPQERVSPEPRSCGWAVDAGGQDDLRNIGRLLCPFNQPNTLPRLPGSDGALTNPRRES
ncbi:hypothetical protein ACWD62_42170, partial [Streptomyces sp. NPDC005146]